MRVSVKLFGTLRRLSQPDTPGLWQGEIPDGLNINTLVQYLGTRIEEVAAATINGERCELDAGIQPGDEIVLVTPFGGG